MGLYLCIFDGDEEIEGVEVGPYADFDNLRQYIVRELEGGTPGSRFPVFILHSDCDGEWTAKECTTLGRELEEIIEAMRQQGPVPYSSDWQGDVAKRLGIVPANAFESFVDVDGEFVLGRIRDLASIASQRDRAIIFQ
ncbi:Imm70 family immunity protein [Burkholderia contaminans]|uniref:Imm70 family immunity protein n=1 Tax=Burkholderia contaminans TaxID=488447 RepID=UPI002D7E64D3|nr:Imm70 family immunity protein [Burkholderia contaminans]